jgi:hypothetical protein
MTAKARQRRRAGRVARARLGCCLVTGEQLLGHGQQYSPGGAPAFYQLVGGGNLG